MHRSSVAILAAIALLTAATACGSSDTTAPNSASNASIDGTWTGATSAYTSLRVDLVERAEDHQLFGRWTGARANCSAKVCVDSGIVFTGSRTGANVSFGITSLNGTRSLAVTGLFDGTTIHGNATLTDDGSHFPAEPVVLHR